MTEFFANNRTDALKTDVNSVNCAVLVEPPMTSSPHLIDF